MKELSTYFTIERMKVNNEIHDERSIAHCHCTINKLEEDVKEFIRQLKFKLCGEFATDPKFNERWINKLSGDALVGEGETGGKNG